MYIFFLDVTKANYTCTATTPVKGLKIDTGFFFPARYPILAKCDTFVAHNTGLTEIRSGAWLGSEHLKYLIMYGNSMTSLAARLFENLYLLEHLNLTSNKIASIDLEAFSNLTSLTELDL